MHLNHEAPTPIDFNRGRLLQRVAHKESGWDVIVIGGGATGLGIALDAASRGYETLLLEQADFAKGTSSRSTKLVHGGVRYLAQGDVQLVYEALFERGLLLQNAPHLVRVQAFVIPNYSWRDRLFYGLGLKIYDWMSGKYSYRKTSLPSKKELSRLLPNLKREGLVGGVVYYDGQFDDARLAVNIAQTCVEQGGVVLNYMKVSGLLKDDEGKVCGLQAHDALTGNMYELKSKVVINATGVFVNGVMKMDNPVQEPLVRPSQGVHLVLDKSFLQSDNALMIPKTSDGRVLFAVPWHGHVLLGTTDTPLETTLLEPVALEQEISFILQTAGQYLLKKPAREDVLSVFAGLRPLAAPVKNTHSTKEISRSHKILTSPSNLITVTGGKWTTYRRMAEDTVDKAIQIGGMRQRPCVTKQLKIHGSTSAGSTPTHLSIYGTDAEAIAALIATEPALGVKLHPQFPNLQAEVIWAVRNEMAHTIEDVLARRLRILFLDAKAAIAMAPQVAALVAAELGFNLAWQQQQVKEFTILANGYLLKPHGARAVNPIASPIV